MDIQAIGRLLKKNGANVAAGAAGDAIANPANAFSTLVETMGARFGTNLGDVNNLASKLIKNDDLGKAARVDEDDAPVRAKDDDKKTEEKPKAAKSKKKADDKDDKSGVAANDDQNTTNTDANADQAQASDAAAAQAAVAAAVDMPVVVETQAVAVTTAVVQAAAAVDTTTPVEQAVQQAAQTVVDPTAQVATQDVTAKAAVETAQTATVTDAPKVAEATQNTFQQQLNTAATTQAATEETVEEVAAPIVKQETVAKNETAGANRQQVRSAAAQEQSQDLARSLANDDKIQVQVKVAGPRYAGTTLNEPSSYNIYTGYTAGNQDSVANGQAGKADATNALVAKSPAEQVLAPVLPSSNVAPPQAQTSQQGTTQAARADLEVQAVSSTSQSSSSGSQTNSGSEFGSALNNGNSSTSSTNASQATQQTNAPQRPAATVQEVVDQIKVSITRASKVGLDRVTIQLKPVELGRIDVKLEMSDDHKVRVTVMADTKETLNLLQSDSHTLERALNDAGLRTDANNLHFSLREGSDQRANDGQNGQNTARSSSQSDEADVAEDDYLPTYDYGAAARSRGGVDTFA